MPRLALRPALVACVLLAPLRTASGDEPLKVYGPGGPLTPLRACAERFTRTKGVAVKVDGGPEEAWVAKAEQDADLVFGAAEYVLTDLARRHPELLDLGTRASLWDRPAAILVRKGNPRKIHGIEDLAREGVKLLDVTGAGQAGLWEDLAGRKGLIPAIQRNIVVATPNTAEAIAAWRTQPELDAWITFASWHDRLRDEADLVPFPAGERIYRGTPIAVTRRSRNRDRALAFVAFLKSEECHALFRAAGWR
jgi:accessory colonization factor AcfC